MKKELISMDGNSAAAHVAYAYTEVAGIFPITPSSTMAEIVDSFSAAGRKNIFGNVVKVMEMQSEAGAAGVVHGALQGGALSSTFTASQGLLLMIPNIYKCVGELLPVVFHVSARAIATRALSIFGDHQDIYSVRQTGAPMLCSHSVQEVMDLAPVAHLAALEASVPFINFFDGFRTSHEIQKIEVLDYEILKSLINEKSLENFRKRALNPHGNPVIRGGAENDDIYFQGREAQNLHFDNVVNVVEKYMDKISEITGRKYAPFTYYGHPEATKVIVAMGSVTETISEVIDTLEKSGEKVGLVKVHLYRPFAADRFLKTLPKTVKHIAVLDRTKEMGATGEPLYLDVKAVVSGSAIKASVIGGRYGLSSKDVQPKHLKSIYDFMGSKKAHHNFTIGINDDVTNLSVPIDENFKVENDYTSCLFYGLGSDGTVSANKNSIKIIGDNTDLYSQAYFAYDSKKAGGATRSHLRFGKSIIRSTYYVESADFISCSLDSYLFKYDMLRNIKDGGVFLLNTSFTKSEIESKLPNRVKKQLADKNVKFYIIDASKLASEIGMGRRTNTILQSSFFKLNPQILPYEEAIIKMKDAAKKTYGKKGEEIVNLNYKAIELGGQGIELVAVDPSWSNLKVNESKISTNDAYFDEFVSAINNLEGYDLPVSAFLDKLDGSLKTGIAAAEKRTIATEVPKWLKENCIQCNKCVFVCPHATIRAFLVNDDELAAAPDNAKDDVLQAAGGPNVSGLKFRIQVDPQNCVGCSLCVAECPGKNGQKALAMSDVKVEVAEQAEAATYFYSDITYKSEFYPTTIAKGASFLKPYFENSGACAGCGETPYYRLVSQLFGKDMLIANATGCSSIYSASTPSTPFTVDKNGEGPSWGNSLFEDNAEYGMGMRLAVNFKLNQIKDIITANINNVEAELKEALQKYLDVQEDRKATRPLRDTIITLVENSANKEIKQLLQFKNDIVNKSVWIIGGDGWAYDIGYGGLDHVIANNENVNILVLDTEVYSNTGGQASKSTQTGAVAKFAASGKMGSKKDFAAIAMMYGHVYVANVSMGANNNQLIKAFEEAESYNGPSIIFAYSPCIEQGIKGGLMNHQRSQRSATECGYFPLFRYDPRLEAQGKNPLQIDSAEPNFDKFNEFILSETRFSQVTKVNPEQAQQLLDSAKHHAQKRYERLRKLAQ